MADGGCHLPFAYMQDVGATFGHVGAAKAERKLDLEGWRAVPIWKDAATCLVKIESPPLHGATFGEAVDLGSGTLLPRPASPPAHHEAHPRPLRGGAFRRLRGGERAEPRRRPVGPGLPGEGPPDHRRGSHARHPDAGRGVFGGREERTCLDHRNQLAGLLLAVSLGAATAWAAPPANPEPGLAAPASAPAPRSEETSLREAVVSLPVAAVLGAAARLPAPAPGHPSPQPGRHPDPDHPRPRGRGRDAGGGGEPRPRLRHRGGGQPRALPLEDRRSQGRRRDAVLPGHRPRLGSRHLPRGRALHPGHPGGGLGARVAGAGEPQGLPAQGEGQGIGAAPGRPRERAPAQRHQVRAAHVLAGRPDLLRATPADEEDGPPHGRHPGPRRQGRDDGRVVGQEAGRRRPRSHAADHAAGGRNLPRPEGHPEGAPHDRHAHLPPGLQGDREGARGRGHPRRGGPHPHRAHQRPRGEGAAQAGAAATGDRRHRLPHRRRPGPLPRQDDDRGRRLALRPRLQPHTAGHRQEPQPRGGHSEAYARTGGDTPLRGGLRPQALHGRGQGSTGQSRERPRASGRLPEGGEEAAPRLRRRPHRQRPWSASCRTG